MAKKRNASKVHFSDEKNNNQEIVPQRGESAQGQETAQSPQPTSTTSQSPQPTSTTSQSTRNASRASKRGVCAMHKVLMKKAQGKKFKVRCNEDGTPVGDTRHTLQSYIGMLARTMVAIDIASWPEVNRELKEKIWMNIEDTFEVPLELKKTCLQSAGVKWRQFKTTLTTEHIFPYMRQKKRLVKPPKQYAFVGKEAWRRFVAERCTPQWLEKNKKHANIVKKRKYPHRASRKGYIGLQEEEASSGRLEPGEIIDRAVLWKKARSPKDPTIVIDEGLAEINKKIDSLLERKLKGEFKPVGTLDVLSTALETPEHSGRVRGVGSFVTPTKYFNIPRGRRNRVTKDELLARDKRRDEEFDKRTEEFEMKTANLMAEIADLKSLIGASNLHSPILSDKASCRGEKEQAYNEFRGKPATAKELMADHLDPVDEIDPVDPPQGKKIPRKCELSVDSIENKVAFGVVFDEGEMATSVHGVPLNSEHARVSIDGFIKPDAMVPVPIPGEIEMVHQALGAHLAWPRNLIIYTNVPTKPVERKRKEKPEKGELQRLQSLFKNKKLNENVPDRFKLLYKHASCFMKETGASIQIPCDVTLFGVERTIFLLHENIIALSEFAMIGQAVLSTYMSYLQVIIREKNSEDLYAFFDPGRYKLNSDFESYIVKRLNDGVLRMHLMPYNYNMHWILIVIWESEIFLLNPLSHQPRFPELENTLSRAVRAYNAENGRVNKNPKFVNLSGCPKQPGGTECGYVVMRYMKEIIEDKEMKFMKAWSSKSRKCYSKAELDVVRMETLGYIEEFM